MTALRGRCLQNSPHHLEVVRAGQRIEYQLDVLEGHRKCACPSRQILLLVKHAQDSLAVAGATSGRPLRTFEMVGVGHSRTLRYLLEASCASTVRRR
jgi:hypothetical protein